MNCTPCRDCMAAQKVEIEVLQRENDRLRSELADEKLWFAHVCTDLRTANGNLQHAEKISDLLKLKLLLDEFGVEYTDEPRSVLEPGFPPPKDPTPWLRHIGIDSEGAKQIGYVGFRCEFYFDDDENFVKVGVWE